MASSLTATITVVMIANFPEMVTRIVGEPTLHEPTLVLNTNLIACDQSHMTMVSPLSLLYLGVLPDIYLQYIVAAYPDAPMDSGPWDGDGKPTALGRTASKAI